MKKNKTVRKHELRERIRRLEISNAHYGGEMRYQMADIFEEYQNIVHSNPKSKVHEHRRLFREMTHDLAPSLYYLMKEHVKTLNDRGFTVYFGTNEEFEKAFGKPED
jgi:L-lactate utilization protein LutB